MKSTIYSRLIIAIIIAGLVAACQTDPEAKKKQEIADKKEELAGLKKEFAELTKNIKTVEEALAKLSPDTTVVGKEVAVTKLANEKFDHFVQTQGAIESENNIDVSAQAMGIVEQVFVTEGQQVSKGQVLAQIDNSVILRNIESVKSQLELATSVYNRQKNLWDQKIGTEVQFLQAKTNKEGLEKQIAILQAQNDQTRIKSPINGTVDAVHAKAGQALQGAAFKVINTNELKVVAHVSEAYVTNIKKGNKVLVSLPELNKNIDAVVTFIGKNINPLSRSFDVEVKLPTNVDLRPNMTATIRVIFETEPSVLVVPVNVIQTLNDQKVVYIAETEGKKTVARKKVVTVGGVFASKAKVEGLKPGDQLITFGYQGLNDGEAIKI